MPAEHRVAITGLGLITPIGTGREAFWKNLLARAVAVAPISRFDVTEYPSKIAAQIDDFDPAAYMQRRRLQWTDRFSQLAVVAALLACQDAGIRFEDRADVGVFTGSALGGLTLAEEQLAQFQQRGLRALHPLLTLSVFGGAACSNIAIEFGLHGPTIANADSCAAGAIAIGDAFRAIRRGELRAAIAGGVEAPLAPLTFGAFTVARAMSTRNDDPRSASRPFDRDRDGFVMSEGAGIIVLERLDDAVDRGARVYAEITGYGTSNDAFHMAAPRADGAQVAGAMHAAMSDAGIGADDVEAINAHGSSTPLGDRAEMQAYRNVFGDRAERIPVTASKGQHGHALGATGAWEVAVSAMTLSERRVPATVNFGATDDGFAIDCTTDDRSLSPRIVLSNSSGFGGINAVLILQSVG